VIRPNSDTPVNAHHGDRLLSQVSFARSMQLLFVCLANLTLNWSFESGFCCLVPVNGQRFSHFSLYNLTTPKQ
jgi:hypothetical protein